MKSILLLFLTVILPFYSCSQSEGALKNDKQTYAVFKSMVFGKEEEKEAAVKLLHKHWKAEYVAPLLEIIRLSADNNLTSAVMKLLHSKIGKDKIPNFYDGMHYLWSQPASYADYYFNFKADLYKNIDPLFQQYFENREEQSKIRLDEVLWGGVLQDGIPPLRFPKMISAQEADYLDDDNIVYGFAINGVVRAYPKRILAWHEFFVDTFGDIDIAGVFCTLCGTVIAYDMTHNGIRHDLGTSGFLYRSNKLMYDKATQSLWNTIEGKPVIGPLTKDAIVLETHPVVTTTWGEWKTLHPYTEVLSLETGHKRNYDEGHAYNAYFSTDELMFPVPKIDTRLLNKDEVFVIRIDSYELDPKAFSRKFLVKNSIVSEEISEIGIVILTDDSGASRAYESKKIVFKEMYERKLFDEAKNKWIIQEDYLINDQGDKLKRLPAHNIFWFAWYNAYPNTKLVK